MLSSQTKDEVTSAAVDRLREAVGGSLSVDAILRADDSTISDAICKVGFWRRKTQSAPLETTVSGNGRLKLMTDTSSEQLNAFMMILTPMFRRR